MTNIYRAYLLVEVTADNPSQALTAVRDGMTKFKPQLWYYLSNPTDPELVEFTKNGVPIPVEVYVSFDQALETYTDNPTPKNLANLLKIAREYLDDEVIGADTFNAILDMVQKQLDTTS